MNWFPNYQTDKNSEFLDLSEKCFNAVGKILFVSNHFESQCKHVLRISDLVDYLENNKGFGLKETAQNTRVETHRLNPVA